MYGIYLGPDSTDVHGGRVLDGGGRTAANSRQVFSHDITFEYLGLSNQIGNTSLGRAKLVVWSDPKDATKPSSIDTVRVIKTDVERPCVVEIEMFNMMIMADASDGQNRGEGQHRFNTHGPGRHVLEVANSGTCAPVNVLAYKSAVVEGGDMAVYGVCNFVEAVPVADDDGTTTNGGSMEWKSRVQVVRIREDNTDGKLSYFQEAIYQIPENPKYSYVVGDNPSISFDGKYMRFEAQKISRTETMDDDHKSRIDVTESVEAKDIVSVRIPLKPTTTWTFKSKFDVKLIDVAQTFQMQESMVDRHTQLHDRFILNDDEATGIEIFFRARAQGTIWYNSYHGETLLYRPCPYHLERFAVQRGGQVHIPTVSNMNALAQYQRGGKIAVPPEAELSTTYVIEAELVEEVGKGGKGSYRLSPFVSGHDTPGNDGLRGQPFDITVTDKGEFVHWTVEHSMALYTWSSEHKVLIKIHLTKKPAGITSRVVQGKGWGDDENSNKWVEIYVVLRDTDDKGTGFSHIVEFRYQMDPSFDGLSPQEKILFESTRYWRIDGVELNYINLYTEKNQINDPTVEPRFFATDGSSKVYEITQQPDNENDGKLKAVTIVHEYMDATTSTPFPDFPFGCLDVLNGYISNSEESKDIEFPVLAILTEVAHHPLEASNRNVKDSHIVFWTSDLRYNVSHNTKIEFGVLLDGVRIASTTAGRVASMTFQE
eukprot:GHVQ01031149.1.p1 GENE.GHVQ01031149.1~~GHVQ01031149.1.p1  ORF type:complete len:786 (+),score=109.26 GHVQ01031149.1:229-2358(+)